MDRVYLPVLRWKRGEFWALAQLDSSLRKSMLPLIEVVPKRYLDLEEGPPRTYELQQQLTQMAQSCLGQRVLLDMRQVGDGFHFGLNSDPIIQSVELARRTGLLMTPVIETCRIADAIDRVTEVHRHSDSGVAVRLVGGIAAGALAETQRQIERAGIDLRDVDLIVDFGDVSAADGRYQSLVDGLPPGLAWRSLWLLGGSFPRDLSGLDLGQHLIPRTEWLNWTGAVQGRLLEGNDIPGFGDYMIQTSQFQEPPAYANVSASIRYAAETYWVVMRGEGLRNPGGPGHAQYRANAQLLCEREEFKGAEFCAGDAYIAGLTAPGAKPGNPETLLRAGFNHHMSLTCRQVASLLSVAGP